MKLKYTIAALAVTTMGANAAISLVGASSTFDYKYEMDSAPETQDLDSNGFRDWHNVGMPTVSAGLASNTGNNQIYRGDINGGSPSGSIWRRLVSAGAAADWTLELSVAKTAGTQGSNGWFGIASANLGESNSSRFFIKDDRVAANDTDYMVGTNFADGNQHTIRIAHDAVDNALYFWVDGTLLNSDLSTPINGVNGSGFDNSTFIGDYSGTGFDGDFAIDYIRLDNDAIAAVPEPSSTALLGLGGLALILRRRK